MMIRMVDAKTPRKQNYCKCKIAKQKCKDIMITRNVVQRYQKIQNNFITRINE